MPTPSTECLSGAELLALWRCNTREEKLARACSALMQQLDVLHLALKLQSLKANLHNPKIFCSCADAYRMGEEALKL